MSRLANDSRDDARRRRPRTRLEGRAAELLDACDGFLAREAIAASLTADERREILRGMVLTRAVDNRLKQFFTSGEVHYGDVAVPGQGLPLARPGSDLRRGDPAAARRRPSAIADGGWHGDVVGPIIRDLGVALAMRPEPATVRMVLNAQMGKDGPADGRQGPAHRRLRAGASFPPTAPLVDQHADDRRHGDGVRARGHRSAWPLSFIGEGGSSLGEWHEAINLCAARRLPAIFCIENNQTALSTPVREQSAVRVFADKARRLRHSRHHDRRNRSGRRSRRRSPGRPIARAPGAGPRSSSSSPCACAATRITTTCSISARSRRSPGTIRRSRRRRVRRPRALRVLVARRIRSRPTRARLEAEGVIAAGDLDASQARGRGDSSKPKRGRSSTRPGREPAHAGARRLRRRAAARARRAARAGRRACASIWIPRCRRWTQGLPFDKKGTTFLEAVALGVGDALRADPRVFVYGEDVGGQYGNAFLLLRPLLKEFGDRIINSPLAEGAVLGVCVGAALAGQRPIGEMQFNDFVATGFNQLVNNAAKIRYRWGGSVPMVVRMPWGGLRHAGPYHSQNTEAWFYRTPGLKIVVPSTPQDARALMAAAVADPDPVLYYEHIALYRDPRIKQVLAGRRRLTPLPLGKAALRRAGDDLAIISYGAYVHVALRVAETARRRRHRGQRARPAHARAARQGRACSPSRATAAGC